MSARRYTGNKLRYELIPASFLKELARVYSIGADKYTIRDSEGNIIDNGADNWRKGLSWKQTLGAVYRHLEKFKNGEDLDFDYPTEFLDKYGPSYHLANAAWGIAALMEYYRTHPELDDRNHSYLTTKKIALDIDEVLCNWLGDWCKYWELDVPDSWFFDRNIMSKFNQMIQDNTLDNFYLKLKPLIDPSELPFEPHMYITSRPIKTEITEQWIDSNGFPTRPVVTVPLGTSKVDVLKAHNIDIFIDDRYDNFIEINKAGICCLLMDMPHNRRYNVGYKRIYNFNDFKERFL